jgi:16S rRNA (guanine527-N7)-methyltransferase
LINVSPNKKFEDPLGLLKKEADELRFFLGESQINAFALYLEELKFWNKKINLVGRRNDHEIVIKDFLDSLLISKYLPPGSALVDIGSGAGFPGIPVKIYRQDLIVGLLEVKGKRISFLKHMVRLLELEDLKVISPGDEKFKSRYEFSVSRALGSTIKVAKISEPYLAEGGVVLAMKGKTGEDELKRELPYLQDNGWKVSFKDRVQLPVIGHERLIFGLKKFVSRETFS